MKRLFLNERGYTLFIALLITILFAVLAMSLLSFTMSGTTKNVAREEIVQSTELSEKGLNHITHQIQLELRELLGENGLPRNEFAMRLEAILNKYKCSSSDSSKFNKLGKTGQYQACIEEWINTKDKDGNDNDLRKRVTFRSTGIVDGRQKVIKADIEIGAKEVPDALKYAVGSHITCVNNKNCLKGEGNLFLHGGVSIEGDMKVDGNLVTTDRGYAYLGGKQQWIESWHPSAKPGPGARTSKLVLGKSVYTFSNNPNYDTHITRDSFTSGYTKRTNLNDAFYQGTPQLVNREPLRERVEIVEQKENYAYNINDFGITRVDFGSNRTYNNLRQSGKKVFAYYTETYRCGGIIIPKYCDRDVTTGNYTLGGENSIGQFATDGNLTINGGKTTVETGMYVGGNLTIGDTGRRTPSISTEIDGPIFVNGNLNIQGVDAKLNSLIYVNGNVNIEYSRINGLHKKGKEGSLIIFATGQIRIVNNSVNEDTPSNIRGYFYSEDELEMFGVGSNIRIEGGLSARRIVLNAIRGRASSKNFSGAQRITNSDYFEGRSNQVNKNSRLQIIYNPEIINTYADLKQQEPVIYNVDPPRYRSRE